MRWDIGIDLGTQYARTAEYKQGVTGQHAAALAFRGDGDMPFLTGDAAARIDGHCCAGVEIVSPLRDGVLENNLYADRLIRRLYRDSEGLGRIKRFGTMISCAPFARPVQMNALLTAATDAGAAEACLVRSDACCALGAGMDLAAPEAKLVVDLGAGKISCTLFTFGRVAGFGYLPYGMGRIDERIVNLVRTRYGYRIGLKSAREIKHTLGHAVAALAPKELIMHMTGFSLEDRLPGCFDVEIGPVVEACDDVMREVEGLILAVISDVPEEISADLNDSGIMLTGGGAELSGIERRLGDATGLTCRIADAPSMCAARGLFRIMREPEKYPQVILRQAHRGARL